MQFKDKCKPGCSYRTLKTVSAVIKATSSYSPLLCGHLSNMDTSLCPFGVCIREVRLQWVRFQEINFRELNLLSDI